MASTGPFRQQLWQTHMCNQDAWYHSFPVARTWVSLSRLAFSSLLALVIPLRVLRLLWVLPVQQTDATLSSTLSELVFRYFRGLPAVQLVGADPRHSQHRRLDCLRSNRHSTPRRNVPLVKSQSPRPQPQSLPQSTSWTRPLILLSHQLTHFLLAPLLDRSHSWH